MCWLEDHLLHGRQECSGLGQAVTWGPGTADAAAVAWHSRAPGQVLARDSGADSPYPHDAHVPQSARPLGGPLQPPAGAEQRSCCCAHVLQGCSQYVPCRCKSIRDRLEGRQANCKVAIFTHGTEVHLFLSRLRGTPGQRLPQMCSPALLSMMAPAQRWTGRAGTTHAWRAWRAR